MEQEIASNGNPVGEVVTWKTQRGRRNIPVSGKANRLILPHRRQEAFSVSCLLSYI